MSYQSEQKGIGDIKKKIADEQEESKIKAKSHEQNVLRHLKLLGCRAVKFVR